MTNEEIQAAAIEFARRNRNQIAKELTNPAIFVPDIAPISIFMAGSPGAGKTEFSRSLVVGIEKNQERRVIRIDGDEIRTKLPCYTGSNSYLFQGAISLVIDKVHENALQQKQNFILDGTLARSERAIQNINRSLKRGRLVYAFYVYQKPEVAWGFTQAREKIEGRNIPKSAFISQFFGARETIDKIMREFGEKIEIHLVKKNFQTNMIENVIKINQNDAQIDDYIKKEYNPEILEKFL